MECKFCEAITWSMFSEESLGNLILSIMLGCILWSRLINNILNLINSLILLFVVLLAFTPKILSALIWPVLIEIRLHRKYSLVFDIHFPAREYFSLKDNFAIATIGF